MDASSTSGSHNKWTYIIVGVVIGILLVLAVSMFNYPNKSELASQKAQELIAAYELSGLEPPSEDLIMGVYGDDGGPVCTTKDFDEYVQQNLNQLVANGAAQVGARGVIMDAELLRKGSLIIGVYCPERLPEYQDWIEILKTDDLIRE